MREFNEILQRAEIHVAALFNSADSSRLVFHTVEHTRMIAGYSIEIALHYNLIESDCIIVGIAAWFHDVDYLFAEADKRKVKSVELMKAFMAGESQEPEIVHAIEECILATNWPAQPSNLLQQILIDSVNYHLGTDTFFSQNELLYQEQLLTNNQLSRYKWIKQTIKYLQKHQYFTEYCKDKLLVRKNRHIKGLKKEIKQLKADALLEKENSKGTSQNSSFSHKRKQEVLLLTTGHYDKLIAAADVKGNILLSINAIIASIIILLLPDKLPSDFLEAIPVIILMLTCVVSIIMSILVIWPKPASGVFKQNDIDNNKINLLNFGNFYKMSYGEYEQTTKLMMEDAEYFNMSLLQQTYYSGVDVARKYRLIRIAYTIFLTGIIVSVIAFGIASLLANQVGTVFSSL